MEQNLSFLLILRASSPHLTQNSDLNQPEEKIKGPPSCHQGEKRIQVTLAINMSRTRQLSCRKTLMVVFAVALVVNQIECLQSEKLDEGAAPVPPAAGIMCTMCSSCQNPCGQLPPPPPPPVLPPPPPPNNPSGPYCPPPPPPPPNNPSGPYYPPPPGPQFIYFTGVPGDLYPVEPDHLKSVAFWNFPALVPFLLGYGLLGLWAI